ITLPFMQKIKNQLKALLLLTFALVNIVSQAQDTTTVCKELEFNDLERIVVSQYIISCVKDHWFVNDKGVIKVVKFINDKGQKAWYMSVLIDDQYKDNPPKEYAYFEADVVLIYEGKVNMSPIKTEPNPDLIKCLENVVEDRVYIRTPAQARNGMLFGQRKKMLNSTRMCLGNCSNDLIIIFHENGGTYEKQMVY
ncbi:MAG: hypothetical protein EAZ80_09865, partial [Runella slithyformis]